MSYRCAVCKEVVGPGVSMTKKVVATRHAMYPQRQKAFVTKGEDGKKFFKDDPGGVGVEIAKEIAVCATCQYE